MKNFQIELTFIDIKGGSIVINPIGKNIFEPSARFWNLASRIFRDKLVCGEVIIDKKASKRKQRE